MTVSGRSYFAYSDYEETSPDKVTSRCYQTRPGGGWSHDVTVRNWACFTGRKVEKTGEIFQPKYHKTGVSQLHKVANVVFIN